jgi:hypothetical protein
MEAEGDVNVEGFDRCLGKLCGLDRLPDGGVRVRV